MKKSLPSIVIKNTTVRTKKITGCFRKLSLTFFVSAFVFLLGLMPGSTFAASTKFNSATINSATTICSGSSATLTVTIGTCTGTGSGSYTASYQWQSSSDNISFTNISGAALSTYNASPSANTYYRCVLTIGGAGTCSGITSPYTATSVLITVNQPSVASASLTASPNIICNGSSTTLTQTGGSLGTGATWKWYSNASYTTLVGTGTGATATLSVSPTTTTTYYLRAEGASSPCSGTVSGPAGGVTVTVNQPSVAPTNLTASSNPICIGSSTTLTQSGGSLGTGATWKWYSDAGYNTLVSTGIGASASLTVSPATTTTYYLRAEGTTSPCSGTVAAAGNVTVTVNTPPSITAQPETAVQTVCQNSTATALSITATGTGLSYQWYKNTTASNTGGTLITGATSSDYTPVTSVAGTLYYYCIVSSACAVASNISGSITVSPAPSVTNSSTKTICTGAGTNITLTASPSSSFTWTIGAIAGDITGANAGAGPGINDILTNPGNSAGTVQYIVTPTSTTGSCPGAAYTITVTVNPSPTVATILNQAVCNGSNTTPVNFSGTGTTYNWTNDNTSIGLAASGTGNINSFTAINTSSTAVTATITVTPVVGSGCPGSSSTFTITVNPTPTVATISNQSVCNNSNTSPVTFSGTGTTYNWTNNNTSIGLAASGTGDIASFTATNSGSTAVTATITVTPFANGCPGSAKTFTITVNHTPTVTSPLNAAPCNGSNTAAITFSGTGTTYNWTNDNTSIGLAASGTGNISSFTTTNTGSAAVIATITVTPVTNGCPGTAKTFTLTVNPTPAVATISNQSVCNNSNTSSVTFSGTGTTYNWTNNNTSIGLAASGTGDISSFTATNSGSTAVTATITVTPVANGCSGAAKTFTITVNPTPSVTNPSKTICNGSGTNITLAANTASNFTWTIGAITGGVTGANAGSGATISDILNNPNTAAGTVQYIVTPTSTTRSCPGAGKSITVTVNPSPAVTSAATGNVCSGTAQNYAITGNITGTTYTWSRAAVTGISNTAVTGQTSNPIIETLINSTSSPKTVTYIITPIANGCPGTPFSYVVTVGTPLSGSFSMTGVATCSGSGIQLQVSGTPTGGNGTYTYQWQTNYGECGQGNFQNIAGATMPTYIVPTVQLSKDCHRLIISSAGCSLISANKGKPQDITTAPPTINFGTSVTTICINSSTTLTAQSAVSYTYAWSPSTGLSPATGASVTASPAATTTYTVTGTATSGPTCSRTAEVTVTVNPLATLGNVDASAACSGTNTTVTLNGLLNSSTSTINYTIGDGSVKTISGVVSNGSGTGTFQIPVTSDNNGKTLTITSMASSISSGPACSQTFSTNNKVTLSVNPVPVINATTASICSGTSFTVSPTGVPDGTKYTWMAPTYSGSVNGGSQQIIAQSSISQTLTLTGTTAGTAAYTVTPISGTCSGSSFTVTITVNANTWNGITSNDWSDVRNWCSIVPTNTTDVVIPAGVPNYPHLTASSAVRSVEIKQGAHITLDGKTFTIYGDVSGTGMLTSDRNARLVLNGTNTAGTLYFDNATDTITNALKDFTINTTGTYILGNKLYLINEFASNAGTLNTGGYLTLRSTSVATTARVAPVAGTITGDITVERFIPAKRSFRFLSPSVTTTTGIKYNWMENAVNSGVYNINDPRPGFGTNITGAGGKANGFDPTITNNPSLFTFDASNQKWGPVANTNGTLEAGQAYRLLVRGSRNTDMTQSDNNPDSTNTILRTTGTLKTGDYAPGLSTKDTGYTFIGNPYASPVDFEKMIATANNVKSIYYAYDPMIGRRGSYVLYDAEKHSNSIPGSDVNENIQSGQAVLVQNTGSNPSIEFRESYKSSGNTKVFRDPSRITKLSLRLLLNLNEGLQNTADAAVAFFDNKFSAAIGKEDSYKLTNLDENVAINRNGITLSMEGRPTVVADDTIQLQMWKFRQNSYYLQLTASNFSAEATAFVKDAYLHQQTPVDLSSVTLLPFSITADSASFAANRFSIVFKAGSTLPVTLTNVKAYQKDKGIQVDWTAEAEMNIARYEVERSVNGQQFDKVTAITAKGNNALTQTYGWFDENANAGNNFYRIKVIEKSGAIKYSPVVKVNIAERNSGITIFPNPVKGSVIGLQFSNMEKGRYSVMLYNDLGQKIYATGIDHTGRTGTYTIASGRLISKGTYTLQITKGDTTMTERVIAE